MWWRTTQKEAVANRGEGNKVAMSEKVDAGELVGLLAYVDGAAVGWCSVGPREAYSRLGRSPALTPVDGQEPPPSTWSTVCFFVPVTVASSGSPMSCWSRPSRSRLHTARPPSRDIRSSPATVASTTTPRFQAPSRCTRRLVLPRLRVDRRTDRSR